MRVMGSPKHIYTQTPAYAHTHTLTHTYEQIVFEYTNTLTHAYTLTHVSPHT
jgi:hypothetical protein